MSAAIGAALKKIAVALLTDKRALKAIGMAILVIIVALLLPLMAMMAILSGDIELDTGELMDRIEANLSASDIAMLTRIENTMDAIQDALTEKEMPSRVREAQALYIMALYDKSGSSNFVSRLVSCFWENQTDTQLINAVNSEFGTNIAVEECRCGSARWKLLVLTAPNCRTSTWTMPPKPPALTRNRMWMTSSSLYKEVCADERKSNLPKKGSLLRTQRV